MPSPVQSANAIARLEQYRRMITLDEAVEIVTGRRTPFARRAREAARNLWLDISHAATAPFRKENGPKFGQCCRCDVDRVSKYGLRSAKNSAGKSVSLRSSEPASWSSFM